MVPKKKTAHLTRCYTHLIAEKGHAAITTATREARRQYYY